MTQRTRLWIFLFAVAALPRLLGALFLPNTFGDAYVYIRDIGILSTKIKAGTFALKDLYGFWLPLYQFISAIANVFVGNGFYTGKIVSALAGIGVCLLVHAITLRVVQNQTAALLAFLLIALNPLHIMNSASAMTDVPHALLGLASLYCVLKKRWVLAAVFAALAGLTRVESWMLIALIPTIQFWQERRVSIPAILIMLLAPLFWFYVSWKATGDWLACFKVREQYKDWLLTQNPALAEFSVRGVIQDTAMLVSGIDLAVLCASLVAGYLVLRRLTKRDVTNGRNLMVGKVGLPPRFRANRYLFNIASAGFLLSFSLAAGCCLPDASATNYLSQIRPDSFQCGHSDPSVDLLRNSASPPAMVAANSDRDCAALRCELFRATCRRSWRVESLSSATPRG